MKFHKLMNLTNSLHSYCSKQRVCFTSLNKYDQAIICLIHFYKRTEEDNKSKHVFSQILYFQFLTTLDSSGYQQGRTVREEML